MMTSTNVAFRRFAAAAMWTVVFGATVAGTSTFASDQGADSPSSVFDTAPANDPTVGTLDGSAGTTGGASSYSVPLVIPPGRAGMQPALALNYNSRGGDGIMGMGWSLTGTSSIHRCPQTPEQDGHSLGVRYNLSDKLCLDGQRLVSIAGTYGTAGAEYRTEVDSYARVYQAGGDIQSGTACFRVEQKSGRILHYGSVVAGTTPTLSCATSTAHARVVAGGVTQPLSWLVERIDDRVGNNQTYVYSDFGNGEVLLQKVAYTGYTPTSVVGDRTVTFAYTSRSSASINASDSASSYLAGGLSLQTQALLSITTAVAGTTVRTYTPTYTPSAHSRRVLLNNIQDCAVGSAGNACHPATHFVYNDGALDFPLTSLAGIGLPSANGTLNPYIMNVIGDLDGDGTRETIAFATESDGVHDFLVQLTADRAAQSAVDISAIPLACFSPQCYADLDGTGKSALLEMPASTAVPQNLSIGIWNLPRGAVAVGNPFTTIVSNITYSYGNSGPIFTADVDGDGKSDVIVVGPDAAACGSDAFGPRKGVFVWLNTLTGPFTAGQTALFTPTNGTRTAPLSMFCLDRVPDGNGNFRQQTLEHMADFTGDGLPDFFLTSIYSYDNSTVFSGVRLTQRAGSGQVTAPIKPCLPVAQGGIGLVNDGSNLDDECNWYLGYVTHWMDVNGDGLEDFVIARPAQRQWQVRLNQGNGTLGPVITPTGNVTAGLDTYVAAQRPYVFKYAGRLPTMDVDGDGKPDLLIPSKTQGVHGFALKMCGITAVAPTRPQECPGINAMASIPPGTPDVDQYCPAYACPDNPDGTAPLLANTGVPGFPYQWNGWPAFSSYDNATQHGGATAYDNSTYHLAMLKFVQTGPSALRLDLVETPVVSRLNDVFYRTDDVFGDGLADLLSTVGCANVQKTIGNRTFNACSVVGAAAGITWGPLNLPDANQTPTATFETNPVLYGSINQGLAGIGGSPLPPELALSDGPATPRIVSVGRASALLPAPVMPELLDGVINGLGDTASWGYLPMGTPSITGGVPLYTVPATGGYVDSRHYYFESSMPVVFGMLQSGPAGGYSALRNALYGYGQAMYNHFGRGFQGFRTVIEENSNLVRTTTTYNQKFPLTGKVASVITGGTDAAGITVHNVRVENNAWICGTTTRTACPQGDSLATPTGATVYAPLLDTRTVQSFDLTSGAGVGHATTVNATSASATASGWDIYGNLRNQVATSSDDGAGGIFVASHTVARSNTFVYDTTAWWVDKLTQAATTTSIAYAGAHALPAGATAPPHTTTTTFAWNANRTPLSHTFQPGIANQEQTTTYGIPSPDYGLPSSVAMSGSAVTPSPRTTQFAYTKDGTTAAADGYFVLRTTNPLLQATTTERRVADGQVSRLVDPNNLQTTTTFDAFGRETQQTYLDANNASLMAPRSTSYTRCVVTVPPPVTGTCPGGYGEDVNEAYATYRVTSVQTGYPTEVDWFDLLGQRIKHVERGFNGTLIETLTDYDDIGVVADRSTPFFIGSVPCFTAYQYDQLNRPLLKQSPGAEMDPTHGDILTSYSYNGTTTSIKVRGANVSATCSSSTNLCMDMKRSYDVLGRLEQTVQNNGASANYAITNYWYDGLGNPVAAKDAEGNVLAATYNDASQRTQTVDPDAGTSSYTYDALGELLSQTDARGIVTAHVYDALGRLTQRTATNATASDATLKVIQDVWSYDPTGTNGGAGLLGTAKRSKGATTTSLAQIWQTTHSYIPASKRLSTASTIMDGQSSTWTLGYTYDANGRESSRTYQPSNLTVVSQWDAYDHLLGLQNGGSGQTWWTHSAEDAWGNITAESYPGGPTGTHVAYASTGQLKKKTWANGATPLDEWDYRYDSFGNVLSQQRTLAGTNAGTESLGYDGLQRLTSDSKPTCNGLTCTGTPKLTAYGYSASGNIDFKSDYSRSTAGSYGYHANGCGAHGVSQVTTPICNSTAPPSPLGPGVSQYCGVTLTYSCDTSGNVTGGSTLTATYDFNNQPWTITRAGAGTTQFAYDPNGDRFKELSSSQSTWFGGRGVERTVSGGTTTDRHELGPVAIDRVGTTDTVYYQLRDRLGSPGAVGTGANAPDTRSFGAFGEARNGSFGTRNNGRLNLLPKSLRAFTAHEHLDDVYLIHMNGRVYDYGLGRFLSVDPVVQFPANSQSLNPYSYVLNNPLSGKDPSGYFDCDDKGNCTGTVGEIASISRYKDGTVTAKNTDGQSITLGKAGDANVTKVATAFAASALSNGSATVQGSKGNEDDRSPDSIASTSSRTSMLSAGEMPRYSDRSEANVMAGYPWALPEADKPLTDPSDDLLKLAMPELAVAHAAANCVTGNCSSEALAGIILPAIKVQATLGNGLGGIGRAGKQTRLRELADDDKLGSADRGWIRQEINSIDRGQRSRIRNTPGSDLAHERGREAAKGYDYKSSNLQDRDLHKIQHKYDDFGRANTERSID